jgi:hypothetical protein
MKAWVGILLYFSIYHVQVLSQNICFSPPENLTTSGRLPAKIKIRHSNNNLDLAYYSGRYYLAFRTAPSHFASKKTHIYVVSSADRKNWEYETEIHVGKDLREPRFVVFRDSLFLYFFIGGSNMFTFEPQEVALIKSGGEKRWTPKCNVGLDGFVPWRIRNRNDTLFLSAYYGKNLYSAKHRADLRIFFSENGTQWQPVSEDPQVVIPYAEEGEFIFDKSGCLYSVVRLESNGSLVCRADRCEIPRWKYKRYKHKYDSSLLFEHNNDIYLIARRNVPGEMDRVKSRKSETHGRIRNLVHYWFSSKRTALFKLDKENLSLEHLFDFPSNGDNAFPAIVKLDSNQYWLMNYSSDIKKKNKIWFTGQLGKTYIYETILSFNE